MLQGVLLQVVQPVANATDTIQKVSNGQGTAETISLMNLIIKGGFIMIPIGILFVITLYIFFERFLFIRKAAKQDAGLMLNVKSYITNGKIDEALALCRSKGSSLSRMIEKGIKRIGRPVKEIEESIEIVGKFEIYELEKNLSVLAIVAGIAPMFGFIGTIIGVIRIFFDISISGDVSISSVSSGLYEKMVSSAAGLIVAIIAFVFYHWLNIKVEKIVQKMEHEAMDFIDLLQEPVK